MQLDLESSGSRNLGLINPRDQMLSQAILHFDAAISMDPNYAPAYLNKACAYMLLGDAGRARFYSRNGSHRSS
ncbi:MAG: tetratricopeptide repeat protein [Haliscomenobacter sp.]|nr:tetratricopeptide repeat protein [Haliscomenobacter sp.]